jgi:bla regulator protein BlaR1
MQSLLIESAIRATLIAAVIALVLWIMRIKTASVLHAMWASVVLLMMVLPVWVAWGPRAPLPVLPVVVAIAPPDSVPPPLQAGLAETVPHTSPVRQDGGYALWDAVTTVYLLGFGVLLFRLSIGTIRARRLKSCVAPITVGILRPRILLPEIAKDWPQAQLDAVLAHEGEHIRRRDPLFQWLALLNRAIFWFHPLAWWLERKLSGLAEEACDTAVITQGHDPREYSEYLLDLARSVERAGARIDAVGMAMPGIGLKHRIRLMLSGVPAPRISRPRMACTLAVCAAVAAILAAGTLVRAQSAAAATPKFDVASIRPCETAGASGKGGRGGEPPIGSLRMACTTVVQLIRSAYDTSANGRESTMFATIPISGGPSWINTERYAINAKAEGNPAQAMMRGPMLRGLLEDRFQLKIRRETREVPIYVLTVARGGPKLKASREGSCPTPGPPAGVSCPGSVWIARKGLNMTVDQQATLDDFIRMLTQRLDRPVIDKTGIKGMFDFHLEFAPDETAGGTAPPDAATDPSGPSIFTAVQEQLGLKLESAKGPGEVLVIDHVEKPSEN